MTEMNQLLATYFALFFCSNLNKLKLLILLFVSNRSSVASRTMITSRQR